MEEFDDIAFEFGTTTIPVDGVTAADLTAAIAGLAPGDATYIVKTANGTLSAEIALDALGGPGIAKIAADGTISIATGADLPSHNHTGVTVGGSFLIDGGGAAIASGIKGDMEIPFAGTITRVRVLQDQSGSIAVSGWKDTLANYPPVVGDIIYTVTISGSATPGDSGAVSIAVAAGDIIRHNVNALATSITRVTVAYTITRSI